MKLEETSAGDIWVHLTVDEEVDFSKMILDLFCDRSIGLQLSTLLEEIWNRRTRGFSLPGTLIMDFLDLLEASAKPCPKWVNNDKSFKPVLKKNGAQADWDSYNLDIKKTIVNIWYETWNNHEQFKAMGGKYANFPGLSIIQDFSEANRQRFWDEVHRIRNETKVSRDQAISYVSDYLKPPPEIEDRTPPLSEDVGE